MKSRPATAPFVVAVALMCSLTSGIFAAPGDENWDDAFGVPGASDTVSALAFFGSDLIAVGGFTSIGGIEAVRIARYDGTNWHPLGDGLTSSSFPAIRALAAFQNRLYVAGAFTSAGGTSVNNIASWDGTNWSACGDGVGGPGIGIVRSMTVAGDQLIVGGTFNFVGGLSTPNIAAWNGTNWAALGGGIPGTAVDSVAASGTLVYAGGRFRLSAGINATNIAMWNGTTWLALGEGIRDWDVSGGGGGMVRTILKVENGVVAAGSFRLAGAVSAINIAKWDGRMWRALASGMDSAGSVYALALNGRDLYVAGYFGFVGSVNTSDIAKWDGIEWSPLGSGIGDRFFGAGLFTVASRGSELVVGGGDITTAGGKPANNIALWHIPHSLSIERTGNNVTLSWPATGTNFLLEATSDLGSPNWQGVSGTPSIVNDQCVVTLPLGPANQFYRLRRK